MTTTWDDDVDDIDLDDNKNGKLNDENISKVSADNDKQKYSNNGFENNKGEEGNGDEWENEDDILMGDVAIYDDAAAITNYSHPNE